ncbi:unnamed protein product, partial [Ectocarpus sp. 8 AP-2014]
RGRSLRGRDQLRLFARHAHAHRVDDHRTVGHLLREVSQGRSDKVGWARVVRDARGDHDRCLRSRAPPRDHRCVCYQGQDLEVTRVRGVLHDRRGRDADLYGLDEDQGARGQALDFFSISQGVVQCYRG